MEQQAEAAVRVPPAVAGGSTHAALVLVVVTLLWGLSFPLVKSWQDAANACPGGAALASATLIALRMGLALVILAVFRPRLLWAPSRREHACGAVIGLVFFLGFTLQVLGLAWTTPALSSFLTSLASAWVPLLAWAWWRIAVPRLTLAGLALGMIGVAVMVEGWSVQPGDALTLLATLLFAVQILLLDRLGRAVNPVHLTAAFIAATGAPALLLTVSLAMTGPGLLPWLRWLAGMLRQPAIARDVVVLTVFSTVLAFHWMNVYQPRVSASRAALIYLLEPVFASLFSVLWGHDSLTLRLIVGGSIILIGNVLVEWPRLLADLRLRWVAHE
jgi:drug/metabolite transporter (DMT)-like permease